MIQKVSHTDVSFTVLVSSCSNNSCLPCSLHTKRYRSVSVIGSVTRIRSDLPSNNAKLDWMNLGLPPGYLPFIPVTLTNYDYQKVARQFCWLNAVKLCVIKVFKLHIRCIYFSYPFWKFRKYKINLSQILVLLMMWPRVIDKSNIDPG